MLSKFYKSIHKTFLTFLLISVLSLMLNPISVSLPVQAKENGSSDRALVARVDNYSFATKEQVPSNICWGVDNTYSKISPINEFWGTDGNYHVIYSGDKKVYINILNQSLQLLKTLEISKDLPIVGNIIQDKNGNYYIA